MTVIVGMTDLLLLRPHDDETRQCLQSVRNATDVLLRMLDEAVDFSRLQTGALQLVKNEFVLLDVIEKARQELALGVAPLKFEARLDDNVPPRLLGDANRLKAVVATLVRSAAKFRSATSYALHVGAEPAAEGDLILHLALGDHDRPFIAQRAFDAGGGKFRTFEGFAEHGFCGSGLGLPVTAGVAELWGGRLSMAEDASSPVLFHVTARFALPSSQNKNDLLAAVEQRLDLDGTLKRLAGSEALFQDLVRFFLEDAPVVLAELGTALKRDDVKVAERAAHSLKGLVANFGAGEATRLATDLQRLGHEGALAGAVPLYQRLETEVNLLRRELEAYQAHARTR
jgi:HPt (histidine-containing phosphotransfer) domain-containing protein